jgi:hypothetical protein
MERKEYNGWTNYETWAVALWMNNEEGSQRFWSDCAAEVVDAADANGTDAACDLADMLKSQHEEAMPDLGATVWADLLGAAMSEVNWYEIAEHLIADLPKEAEV